MYEAVSPATPQQTVPVRFCSAGTVRLIFCQTLPSLSDLSRSDERYLPLLHPSYSTVHAHWNNRIPAQARTGITIAAVPLLPPPQDLARSVTSPLTSRCYGGIKRQRKTITDPLTLISQTSGRWEKSTYRVRNKPADWACARFCYFYFRSRGVGGSAA